ncbi:MAG: DUF2304 domain-containing protein [Candidatus Sulfobium sp.]
MLGLVQLVSISVSIFIFVVVIELIRRNHLKERYSLIWLATSLVLILFSVWRRLLDYISLKLGIYYPPSFLFLVAITFLIVLLLHFSTIISSLSEKNKRLAQEMGILKSRLDLIEKKTGPSRRETSYCL